MTTPEGTTTEETADDLSAIHARLGELIDKVDEFRELRVRDIENIARLHDLNDELRKDQLSKAMAPLFQGLIKLYDLMADVPDEDDRIRMLRAQLVQVLEMNGVTVHAPQPGGLFDSGWQDGFSVLTAEPEADATIARVHRAGFIREGTVVRAAQVEVYRLRPSADLPAVG